MGAKLAGDRFEKRFQNSPSANEPPMRALDLVHNGVGVMLHFLWQGGGHRSSEFKPQCSNFKDKKSMAKPTSPSLHSPGRPDYPLSRVRSYRSDAGGCRRH